MQVRDLDIGLLFDRIRDAVIVADAKTGQIVLWNPAAESLFGYSATEALGLTVEALAPAHLKPRLRAARSRYWTSSQGRHVDAPLALELLAIRKTGEELLVEMSLSSVHGPTAGGHLLLAIVRDVTGRKRIEEEQARSSREAAARARAELLNLVNTRLVIAAIEAEQRLEALFEAAKRLSESLSLEPVLATVLDVARQLFGADRAAIYHSDASGRYVCLASCGLSAGYVETVCHHCTTRPGGSPAVATGSPILFEDVATAPLDQVVGLANAAEGIRAVLVLPLLRHERGTGTLIIYHDRPRRYAPEEVLVAQALATQAAIAIDNARLYQEAQEAVRARNDLLYVVSHDLKNPLTTIKGQAQLLARRVIHDGTPEGARLVEGLAGIDAMVTKMTAQLDELLDLARLQAGEPLDLDRRPTDLVALARQLVDQHQQATEHHQVRLETDGTELTGTWDPVRLERTLANLLGNAVKYSPSGGQIAVALRQEPGPAGDWAVLEVRDQGLGIPAADLPHIFERFRRAGNVGRIAGTGVGLLSARWIVEQHGGKIAVASEEGVGSTFTIRLPLAPCEDS